jgi:N-acetyl sugar amidotransferase
MQQLIRCTRCLYNETVPGIILDSDGICNYCHLHDRLEVEYPTGYKGIKRLREISRRIKRAGRGKQYNVIVGISGGCDSSYLLYLTKEKLGLRPLAVHFDNTWNSGIAIDNIHNVTKSLNVDLYTYTVDSKEYDDICRAFLRSSVQDVDIANDIGFTTVLYLAAEMHDVRSIFIGHSFRTEGIAPIGWTYMDGEYIESVQRQYGTRTLETFPNLWLSDFLRWAAVKKIKRFRPLYYIDYIKEEAKRFLSDNLGWQWYGGHHLENQFTSFVSTYFLPRRYGIDVRLLGYAALVRSGQMDRDRGLKLLQEPQGELELVEMVKDRLQLSGREFDRIMHQPKKTYKDFRTYKRIFECTRLFWWLMYKLNRVPKSFYIKYAIPEGHT